MYVCVLNYARKKKSYYFQVKFYFELKLFSSDSNDFFGNVIYIYVIAYANFQ